jgi:hypothetical protein
MARLYINGKFKVSYSINRTKGGYVAIGRVWDVTRERPTDISFTARGRTVAVAGNRMFEEAKRLCPAVEDQRPLID